MSDTQKKFYKKIYGRIGEIKAARYLKKQGMKILERNFRSLRGEVDIVAEDGDTLVFVEVKSRSSETYGQAVTAFKQRKYAWAAEEYVIRKHLDGKECRFDVVEVKKEGINHIKAAFIV